MAIVKCPYCGNKYSEHVERCPLCAMTMTEAFEASQKRRTQRMKYLWIVSPIVVAALLVVALLMYFSIGKDYFLTDSEPSFSAGPAVDLGLSVEWASCNLGASSPEEWGDYYTWGATSPQVNYGKKSYDYDSAPSVLPSYVDAAHVNLGGSWRMPTDDEWAELINNCQWTWMEYKGHCGYEVRARNGKCIFLPAAGYRLNDDYINVDFRGYYWSSNLYPGNPIYAWRVCFFPGEIGRDSGSRFFGRSVRPVRTVEGRRGAAGITRPTSSKSADYKTKMQRATLSFNELGEIERFVNNTTDDTSDDFKFVKDNLKYFQEAKGCVEKLKKGTYNIVAEMERDIKGLCARINHLPSLKSCLQTLYVVSKEENDKGVVYCKDIVSDPSLLKNVCTFQGLKTAKDKWVKDNGIK